MTLSDCHPSRKMQARGMCKPCYDKWLKLNNPSYKLDQKENTKNWLKRNPEKSKAIQKRRQLKDKTDPSRILKRRDRWLKRKYNIDINIYNDLLKQQNNCCALCFRQPTKIQLHVDHCHKTGKVRGLLCHQCNWYLGTIDADPEIINRIVKYINEIY